MTDAAIATATATSASASGADNDKLSPRWLYFFIGLVIVVNLPLIGLLIRPAAETTVTIPPTGFVDDFNRADLGPNYFATGAYWRIANGELFSPGAKNNPLWLKAALPDDVQVEFDARSESADGDLKCEIFGDGYSHASGYILIFGGWSNTITALARLDEHGKAVANFGSPMPNDGRVRVERHDQHVENGKTYHWLIRRQGQTLTWQIDGQTMFEVTDSEPLKGSGHDRFAFSTWDVNVFYDNLKITPLH
jgi:hypothetical protein